MPTTYTHDVFGKVVYQKLPENMKELIQREITAFRVGLHGPDIFFYYKPYKENEVSSLGHEMHREEAAEFFKKCKRLYQETRDEGILVYTLGFICHYMLDSTCHPYIYPYMEKTGASHQEIETELDRTLMEKNEVNPFFYRPAKGIRGDRETVEILKKVFDSLEGKEIKKALGSMRFYTGLTVCPTGAKRRILLGLMRVLRIYEKTQGRVIRKKRIPRCEESTRELIHLIRLAVPETVTVLEDYYRTLDDPQYIGYRFQRNYR